MDKRRERKNALRREQTIKSRKDALCMEYIRLKYSKIYNEVNEIYNTLNLKYPEKNDLRKTDEIKNIQPEHKPEFQDPPKPYRLQFGQHFILKDNIQLRIPLISPLTIPKTSKTEIPTPDITEVEQQENSDHRKTAITEKQRSPNEIPTPDITEVEQQADTEKENSDHRKTAITEKQRSPNEIPTPDITEVEQQADTEKENSDHRKTAITEKQRSPKNTETAITEVIEEGTAFPEIPIDAMSPSLFNQLDSQLLEQIIDELRGGIDLDSIMNSIEDYDMDMNMY